MKGPSLTDRFDEDDPSTDDQITEAIVEALSANNKVIEIRPVERSKGMGLKRLLLLGAVAIGVAYWVWKSQKPDDFIESVKEKTTDRSHEAAKTIEESSETASERIEAGSETAGQAVQEAGEEAAERTEEAGEKVEDEADDAMNFSEP